MIIEFAGISGTGKSSLMTALEERIEGRDYDISWEYIVNTTRIKRILEKLMTFFFTLFVSPKRSVLIIHECLKSFNYHPVVYRDIINIFYLLYRYRKARNSSTPDIWIFDQGLVQACWSILMFGTGRSGIMDLLLDELDYVVVVTAEPERAWNRLEQRSYKGSRVQKNLSASRFVEEGHEYMDRILEQLEKELPNDHLLIVENNGQLEQPSHRVYEWTCSKIDSVNSISL